MNGILLNGLPEYSFINFFLLLSIPSKFLNIFNQNYGAIQLLRNAKKRLFNSLSPSLFVMFYTKESDPRKIDRKKSQTLPFPT